MELYSIPQNIEHGPNEMKTNGKLLMLNVCVVWEQQGFICESNTIKAQNICLDTEQNVIVNYMPMNPLKLYLYILEKDVFV